MEIKRLFKVEEPVHAAGYEIRPVSQLYSSAYSGKAGVCGFVDKRPLFIIFKHPSGESSILSLEGEKLTRPEAMEIAPGIDSIMGPEII